MFGIPSLDPYSAAINIGLKIGGVALIATLFVGGYYEIKSLKSEAKTLKLEKEEALTARDTAIHYADSIINNQLVIEEMYRKHEKTIQSLQFDLNNKKKALYAIKTSPVPKECITVVADFYAPIGAALGMLREAHKANVPSSFKAPDPNLSIKHRATESGK